ncbi:MAG: FG-GAP repeat domain-containing protein, partial [Myxococcota bacterium]
VVAVLDGPLAADGDTIVAAGPGAGTVRVADRHVDLAADVPVTVLAALSADLPRDGERSGHGVVRAAGDIDGDGYDDAVLGFVDIAVDAPFGGAVLVYAGGPAGLAPAPVRTVAGSGAEDTLGRDVAVADLDADGHPDLVVGVDKSDQGGINVGQVRVYAGAPGAYFADAPTRTLVGENAYGRFGSALAACDFDGDGWTDLAVGAVEDEDLATASPAEEQGAIHVFKGAADGFGDDADFVLYGEVPDGAGGFVGQSGMQLGGVLAAGDLDGDGRCDLVAGAPEGSFDGAGGDADGLVLVYRGTDADGLTLTRDPAAILVPSSTADAFGRRVAVGDVDGDGAADLAVAEWKSDRRATDGGAAWFFRGLDLDALDPAVPIDSSDADAWIFGTEGSSYLGSDLDLADLDGDGLAELIVGQYRGGVGDPGVVRVYGGAELAAVGPGTDLSDTTPGRTVRGSTEQGRLGQSVAAVGDAAGDGAVDLLAL